MRIGIDIDDTICNSFDNVLPYLCMFYKLDYKEIKKQNLTYDYFRSRYTNYYDVAKVIYHKVMPNIPVHNGVIKYLKRIKKLGHEIVFVTARGNNGYENAYQISYDYLIKNEVPFDTLIVDAQDKGKVCLEENIDVFFDDDINNYNSVKSRGIEVYLYTIKSNKKYKDVNRVKNFRQIYKIVRRTSRGR